MKNFLWFINIFFILGIFNTVLFDIFLLNIYKRNDNNNNATIISRLVTKSSKIKKNTHFFKMKIESNFNESRTNTEYFPGTHSKQINK